MKVRLILIRHGLTKWNIEGRYAGLTDLPLSSKGLLQAKRLRQGLVGRENIDKIYTSDRKRAIQTARIIFSGRRIKRLSGLREINFGLLEGKTYKEILGNHPLVYRKWLKNPFKQRIPGGETLPRFKRRVVNSFSEIISSHKGETVAVVCHGGVISIFLNHIFKTKDFWKKIPKTASVTVLECGGQKSRVLSFNDSSHLSRRPEKIFGGRDSSLTGKTRRLS